MQLVENSAPGIKWIQDGIMIEEEEYGSLEGYWQCRASSMNGISMSGYTKVEKYYMDLHYDDEITVHYPEIGKPYQVRQHVHQVGQTLYYKFIR